jgi:hypothetical protein
LAFASVLSKSLSRLFSSSSRLLISSSFLLSSSSRAEYVVLDAAGFPPKLYFDAFGVVWSSSEYVEALPWVPKGLTSEVSSKGFPSSGALRCGSAKGSRKARRMSEFCGILAG